MNSTFNTQHSTLNLPWLLKMAWRDSRRSRSRLFLFTSSIILGVAALVAINSFGDNLRKDINTQAKSLMGADLTVYGRTAFSDSALMLLDTLGWSEEAEEVNFASMVYFPKNEGSRLVQVRALEGPFPFYGKLNTIPKMAAQTFRTGRKALADQTLMLQFGVDVGDSIRVGNTMFEIAGKLVSVPGQSGIAALAAAPVYIPMQDLEETGLVQKGSRVSYRRYYRIERDENLEERMEELKPRMRELRLGFDTVEERKRELGNAMDDMTDFLNLVAFVALLLGCVGVASAVHVYIREKISSVAVLRCLGARGGQAFLIYMIQIAVMGLVGSIIGALLGSQIQTVLPFVLADFLPVQVNFSVSWLAILQGLGIGISIAILFAIVPLMAIRKVSPLHTLRASFESGGGQRDYLRWVVYGVIALFIYGFSYLQVGDWLEALAFSGFLGFSFLLLAGSAWGVMRLIRRFFPKNWSYLWRQGLANLYRPNNQTVTLLVSIGLGTALIATLYFMQDLLISQIDMKDDGNRPNMVLFDIQTSQKDEIADRATEAGLPVLQQVPVVTMQLESVKGESRRTLLRDTTRRISRGALNREYRVTFRDSLIDSETLTKGEWRGRVTSPTDSIFISLEEGYGKRALKVDIGDEIVFNVQGALVTTYVGSFREVDFQRVQTNFLVVFPAGVLEEAPQFHVVVTRAPNQVVSARFQRGIARDYPNISVIDLRLILSTVENILDKVSFVIRFMALFSIITGLIVLIGSVIISKYQRTQESILLRTLGASKKQILTITALEYLLLGGIASFMGILLSLLGSWALAYFSFEITFLPRLMPALLTFISITALTVIIGMLNIRSILNQPPLEVLRKEV